MVAANEKVADLLRRYATALQLEGVDRFKIKAYRRAADNISASDVDVSKLARAKTGLESIPGVGKAISAKIKDIVKTGTLPQLERAVSKLPPELLELAAKPQLDPARVKRVYKKLGIKSLEELKERLESGEIRSVLGNRIEFHIRQGLDDRPRMLHWAARDLLQKFSKFLGSIPGVSRVEVAGSHRRRKDTIGDLNYLVVAKGITPLAKRVASFPGVLSYKKDGKNQVTYRLSDGRNVALRFTAEKDWGLSHILSTGSPAHVDQLETALKSRRKALTLKSLGKKAKTEAEIYNLAGLTFIEPELREGRGEIAAAANDALPKLIEVADIRGDLHMHTTASDGSNTILEMAAAAKAKGDEYIAIADHSQSLKITNGLSPKRLLQQCKAIDKVNAKLKGSITVLKSAEVDILEDGKLDYPASVLRQLDLTICSIHSKFSLDKQRQTERLMRAMDNRYCNIIGHATGRLLLRREGYEIDFERLVTHAIDCGCYFEINANPNRLDLSDENAKSAKESGLKLAVNTDAHSIRELEFMPAGINQARRSWLEAKDVLNTSALMQLMATLARK
jgi:DNA polymerase (family 10)